MLGLAKASSENKSTELPVFQSQSSLKWEPQDEDQSVQEFVQEYVKEQEEKEEKPVYTEQETVSFDQVIKHMRQLKQQYQASNQSKSKLSQLEQENQVLRQENEKLEKRVEQMDQRYNMIQEDYQVLMQIMDRARKMIVFDEEDESNAAKAFRMEKNGNLEQVARQA